MIGRIRIEERLHRRLKELHRTLATAESCTGGLIAHRITNVAGASDYFLGGVVAYSDKVKASLLRVSQDDLKEYGAVSEPVARQMAQGVRARFRADYGIGVTGVAGPGGGTAEKPVGLVYIAVAMGGERRKAKGERGQEEGEWCPCPSVSVRVDTVTRGQGEGQEGRELGTWVIRKVFSGSRRAIKDQAAEAALELLMACVEGETDNR